MTLQADHRLRIRHPDVLTCIANLSNDEVFTPPSLANRMLDSLAETWATDHDGDNIWANENVTFLDPCTKSGVFLREITRRLIAGLESKIPDVQKRVDHILTKQVYGIAITSLTAMLARRSLYCSKHADGKHSVTSEFTSEAGNIWFARTEHTWGATKCEFCEARRVDLERDTTLENYAPPFLHTHNIKNWIAKRFGENMRFNVIIGNPPYHMRGGGEDRMIPRSTIFS